jgi:hypothetical protein
VIALDVCARFASAVGNITGNEDEFLDLLRSGYMAACGAGATSFADSVPGCFKGKYYIKTARSNKK